MLMHESTAYDELLDEGRMEGEIRRSHKLLLRLGTLRFGNPAPQIVAELTKISSLERLERMADAILTVGSWDELLAVV